MINSHENSLHSRHLSRLLRHCGTTLNGKQIADEIISGAWPVDPQWSEDGQGLVDVLLQNRELANSLQTMQILGALVLAGCRPRVEVGKTITSTPVKLFMDVLEPGQSQQQIKRQWAACMVLEIATQGSDILPSTKKCSQIVKNNGGWKGTIQGLDMAAWVGLHASSLGEGGGIGLFGSSATVGQKRNACRILHRTLVEAHDQVQRSPLEAWLFMRAMRLQHQERLHQGRRRAGPEGECDLEVGNDGLGAMREIMDEAVQLGQPLIMQKTALQVITAISCEKPCKQAIKLMAHCLDVLDTTPSGLEYACRLECVTDALWGEEVNRHLPGSIATGKAVAKCFNAMPDHSTQWVNGCAALKTWLAAAGDEATQGVRQVVAQVIQGQSRNAQKQVAWEHLALELGSDQPSGKPAAAPRL